MMSKRVGWGLFALCAVVCIVYVLVSHNIFSLPHSMRATRSSVVPMIVSSSREATQCTGVSVLAETTLQKSIYLTIGGSVYALNVDDGAIRWCTHIGRVTSYAGCGVVSSCAGPESIVNGKPAVADSIVYVCSTNGYTYALNASDGSLRWRYQTGRNLFSVPYGNTGMPTVDHGVVYIGAEYLYALDAKSGKLLWRSHVSGDVAPMVVDGSMYVNKNDALYALNASDGSLRWWYRIGTAIGGTPVVVDGVVYFGSGQNDVYTYALNATDGSLRWRANTGFLYRQALVAARGTLYVGAGDSHLYALDAGTGRVLWRYQVSVSSTPIASNDTAYVPTTTNSVYALNSSNGTVRWHKDFARSVSFASSTLIDGGIYILASDGRGNTTLYALDASDGKGCWSMLLSPQAA